MKKYIREMVYNKYAGHCAYCGCEIDYEDMQVDHIVPIERGIKDDILLCIGRERGTDDISNLNPSCRPCNRRKLDFTVDEFRQEIEKCHERMLRDSTNYRQLVRFGQIKLVNRGKIKFYFENIPELKIK